MGQFKRQFVRSQPNSNDFEVKFPGEAVERLVSNLTSRADIAANSSSTVDDHDEWHNVPKKVVIIVVVVISVLLIICVSTMLVFYLRRRKPRRMEMMEAATSEDHSTGHGSVMSRVTVQSNASSKYKPVMPIPTLLADYNKAPAVPNGSHFAIPRMAVKTQAVPASVMPQLTAEPVSVPALPTVVFPEIPRVKSPTPSVQSSLARPGQVLKVMNATPLDFQPVSYTNGIPSQKMTYTDLPKIRTDLVKKNGKITVLPSKPKRPGSTGSMASKASSITTDTGTASSGKPQGPRPLPIPRALHPGYPGNETSSSSNSRSNSNSSGGDFF